MSTHIPSDGVGSYNGDWQWGINDRLEICRLRTTSPYYVNDFVCQTRSLKREAGKVGLKEQSILV